MPTLGEWQRSEADRIAGELDAIYRALPWPARTIARLFGYRIAPRRRDST